MSTTTQRMSQAERNQLRMLAEQVSPGPRDNPSDDFWNYVHRGTVLRLLDEIDFAESENGRLRTIANENFEAMTRALARLDRLQKAAEEIKAYRQAVGEAATEEQRRLFAALDQVNAAEGRVQAAA